MSDPASHRSPLQRDWQVLLVGGASGVGKTTVARELARRFDVPLSQVDGYRLMLERSTRPDAFPALHRYRSDGMTIHDPDELCAQWIEVAREVSGALEIVVAFHAATEAPIVLEGDTILPVLAAARVLAGVPVIGQLRSVFLYEPIRERLGAQLAARGRGYQFLSADARERELHRNMAFGQWLLGETQRHGCPTLMPSDGPNGVAATADRVIDLLNQGRQPSGASRRVAAGVP
jgi:2-phosphoglycerate kinase